MAMLVCVRPRTAEEEVGEVTVHILGTAEGTSAAQRHEDAEKM
jgi:hypothetical protein